MSGFKRHEQWSSRLTFLMAAIGAAVGLGNIWKFPFIAGENGGGAFVLVYLLSIVFIALPVLVAEIMLGRRGQQSPPNAMAIVAREEGRTSAWSIVGWFGVLSAYLIMAYYSVIAGWATWYMFKAGAGAFEEQTAQGISDLFATVQADIGLQVFWHGLFTAITAFVLVRGLKKGIERTVKFLMPSLFGLLLLMVGYAAVEGDFARGFDFLFHFELSAINGRVVLMAVGQAFFSIGVAMGLMMGFGAYLTKDISIARSSVIIASMDTLVAILAGLAIFPIVFANGLDPAEGPGLIFVTLPIAFGNMPGGLLFGLLFFILLFFAALTSTIGAMEPVVAWVEERFNMRRAFAATSACATTFVLGIGVVLSFNRWSEWYPLSFIEPFAKLTYYNILDYLTSNLMMPLGGLLIAVFVGWRIAPKAVASELNMKHPGIYRIWYWLIRWIAPVSIALVFLANL